MNPWKGRALARPLAAVIAVSLCVALAPLAGVSPAQAAVAPSSPAFARSIDGYPRYEAPAVCAPTDKPGPQTLRAVLQQTYGSRSFGISRACSGSATSDHHEGRALDWMVNAADPVQRDTADTFIAWLLAPDQYGNQHAMARRLGLAYIIWNTQMFRLYDVGRGWQPYTGSSPHTDHVHFSFSWAGARAQTSWYGGRPDCYVPPTPAAPAALAATGLGFTALAPVRLVDSRAGQGTEGACRLGPSGRLDIPVLGVGGVPAGGVAAVVLNVTAVDALGDTYLGAYPAGARWPGTSSVNAAAGSTAAALVVAPLGTDGKVSLVNGAGRVDVVVDLVGYHAADGSGQLFEPVSPTRVLDSREGAVLASGETRSIPLSGLYGVPSDATAVVVNVTTTEAWWGPGYVTVTPGGGNRSATSSVNLDASRDVSNRVYSALGNGALDIYVSQRTHVVVDLVGWFGPSGSRRYYPVSPARLFDSRASGAAVRPLTNQVQSVTVGGRAGVPAAAAAVVMTFTGTESAQSTWAAGWPADQPWQGTSDLNLPPTRAVANLLVAPLSPGGAMALQSGGGTAQAIGDVLGYFR